MSINVGELVATTLRKRNKELSDNITNHNALFHRLNEKGRIKPVDGGRDIVEELLYGDNTTVSWYSGYEQLDITPVEVIDAATFDWKQLAGTVSINGLDEMKNSGKEAVINLLEGRIEGLQMSMRNAAATACYANGTTDPKSLGGLQLLVADDPTASATVGGINQATYSFWQNKYSASAATSANNIISRLNALWIQCVRGTDKPDLLLADSTEWNFYISALQAQQRFTNDSKMAGAGFQSLKFNTADFVYDDACTAKRVYLLNTDYLALRPHKQRQFVTLNERESLNQDAKVIPVVWGGNMTCRNRSLQGVMIDD
jgi:hypothetical protein